MRQARREAADGGREEGEERSGAWSGRSALRMHLRRGLNVLVDTAVARGSARSCAGPRRVCSVVCRVVQGRVASRRGGWCARGLIACLSDS